MGAVLAACGDSVEIVDLRSEAAPEASPTGGVPVEGGAGAGGAASPEAAAGGSSGGDATLEPGPLYVVSNTVFGPDSSTSYVTVVDSLTAGAPIDRANFLEFPGSARAYGPDGQDRVYLTSSEDGTITEVTFEPDGSARVGRRLSFANLGIGSTSGGNVNYHISPTQAYFVSRGDRYFASSSYLAGMHFLLPDQAPAPCMLRIRAGETAFDPEWSRSLDEDLATRVWTGVTPAANGRIHVQGIAEDVPGVLQATEAFEISNAQPWTWYSVNGGDGAPVPTETALLNPPLFGAMTLDGVAYVTVWDDVNTTLVDLTSSETPSLAWSCRVSCTTS